MKRVGSVNRLKPGKLAEYQALHDAIWPDIRRMIVDCNVTNYSIFHFEGLLFSYFEYVGDDFGGDMDRMKADPRMNEWWSVVQILQDPFPTRQPGNWWADMDEVFHSE